MKESEKTFQVLDVLDTHEISTQRQLADHSGISLGQVNYILKSLLEKGLIKIGNFRKNPKKIGYVYLLTPTGIETKSRLAVRFVTRKLNEYGVIRDRLAERIKYIEEKGFSEIIFIGPTIVKDFISSILKERYDKINLVAHYATLEQIDLNDSKVFDLLIIFDENIENIDKISTILKVPKSKIVLLW